MLSVKTNLAAWNAARHLKTNTKTQTTLTERLSSGYKINRAADDAAGLSISEKMRRQIRGLTQASANAQDGISMVQSAEGALNEIHEMLHRANELAVKAATGTLTDNDRSLIDLEIQQIKNEIDNTSRYTVFNERRLFPDAGYSPRSAIDMQNYEYKLTIDFANQSVSVDGLSDNTMARAAGVNVSSGSALADKIANTLVPNAVNSIFQAFPSFQTAQGSTQIQLALNISFIDGPGNTLALAGYRYSYGGGPAYSMYIKVDSSDFNDADASGTGSRAEVLESTITHELMHTVMQYNLTDGMSGRKGEKYPTWFTEGTAQLAGGGFTTGWNNELLLYAERLTSENDNSQDGNISNYLKKFSVTGRPYGHGYLACAYIGYLANIKNGGTTDVTGANIARGMDLVFGDLLNGKSLNNAIYDRTGMTEAQIRGLFSAGDADLTEFVRKLTYESKDGAGSVIYGSLSDGGAGTPGYAGNNFSIDPSQISYDFSNGAANVPIQVGAEAGQHIDINFYQMSADALGLGEMNVKTTQDADDAINLVKNAIIYVSNVRSYYGAIQNRLEHTIANLDNVVENTTTAESRIRDTDMAEEMVKFSNNQILLQAGQAMLAQANRQSDIILGLLNG
ncbi:MAG: flagellinolysin [Lachnospiraceae bacterium]|nr:flagellinolysin [Lachnospiraceae bacterium]